WPGSTRECGTDDDHDQGDGTMTMETAPARVELRAGERDPDPVDRSATAKQSTLVWRAFKRHRLAMVGMVVVCVLYAIALFTEFLAPYNSNTFNADMTYAPPQPLHVIDTSA